MKKSDIVERVAGEAGMSKQAAEAAVGAVFASIADALARGEDVTGGTGFGTIRGGTTGRRVRAGTRVPANASPSARRPVCPSRSARR